MNTAERHQDLTPEVAAAHIFAAVEDIAAQVSALHAALEGRAFARVDPDGIVTWHAPSDTLGT